nr:hypothetical protein [Tanacetum cinerariifolium]
ACCDDDDDYDSAITLVLSTEEIENSLSMRGEHLDTILATESDKVIKSSVEDLVPIPMKMRLRGNNGCMHNQIKDTPILEINIVLDVLKGSYVNLRPFIRNFPDPGEWISILNSGIREDLSSTTRVNLPVEDDHSPLLAYVSDGDVVFYLLPHGPMNLGSIRACDTVNKNKALRGRIAQIVKSLVLSGFIFHSQELHILSFILGIQYPNLID